MNSSNKNCLENVILRFDFNDGVIIPEDVVSDIGGSISTNFRYEKTERDDWKVDLQSGQLVSEHRKVKVYSFKNDLGDLITLESDFLSFSIHNYSSYNEFIALVKKAISLLQVNNEELKRLGLRYVNSIKLKEGNPFELNGYIAPHLTQSINFLDNIDTNNLSRNVGQMVFNKSDPDYYLNFLYGWPNSEFPNRIAKKEFVLDYDCYTESNIKINEAFKYIDNFHVEIKRMFVKSIGDELRKKIGEDRLCLI